MEAKIPVPKGWNKRVQSAILHATSLGRYCFVSIVSCLANSPKSTARTLAQNERLKHEVESLREELRSAPCVDTRADGSWKHDS